MKKTLLYSLAALAGFTFASCNGDYDDWSSPQHNDQENAITIPGFSATGVDVVDLANAGDSVKLFTLSQAALPAGTTLEKSRIVLTPANEDIADSKEEAKLNASNEGKVSVAELQAAIIAAYGHKPIARLFNARVYSDVMVSDQAMLADAGAISVSAIPQAPHIENAYYLVGSIDDWSKQKKDEYKLVNGGGDPYSDPVFSVIIPSQGDAKVEFKVVPESGFGADGTVAVWDNVLCATPDAAEGKFSYNNEGGNLTFNSESKFQKYKIELNLIEGTYTVTGISDPKLFLTGSNYNWGKDESCWKPLVRVNGSDTDFWTMIYLHAGEQIKFAPQADWGKDFGAQAEIIDEAGANTSADGTNIKVGNAGWYLLHVTNGSKQVVRFLKPEVYLQGDAIGNWDLKPQNKFTAPADENGVFVSPAFVSDANVRMCVVIEKGNWWKSEFNVFGGKIVFRGNNGDQAAVPVKAGQKAYLDFNKQTGEFK